MKVILLVFALLALCGAAMAQTRLRGCSRPSELIQIDISEQSDPGVTTSVFYSHSTNMDPRYGIAHPILKADESLVLSRYEVKGDEQLVVYFLDDLDNKNFVGAIEICMSCNLIPRNNNIPIDVWRRQSQLVPWMRSTCTTGVRLPNGDQIPFSTNIQAAPVTIITGNWKFTVLKAPATTPDSSSVVPVLYSFKVERIAV